MRNILLLVLAALICSALAEQCAIPMCAEECPGGYVYSEQGCMTCDCQNLCETVTCAEGKTCKAFEVSGAESQKAQCVDLQLPDQCQSPMDRGRCRAAIPRVYYDSESDSCQTFIYGGCGGNDNQFNNLLDCQMACDPDSIGTRSECDNVMCMMFCENGFEKDERGCDKCSCNVPGVQPKLLKAAATVDGPKTEETGAAKKKNPCSAEVCLVCRSKFTDGLCSDCLCEGEKETQTDSHIGFPPVFEVLAGCEQADETECDQNCEFGFVVDTYGCEVCECKPPPTCPDLDCGKLRCEHGLRHDDHGCQVCECREGGDCPKLECGGVCPFGRVVDSLGCERCMCALDPCMTLDCPDSTYCKVVNNTAECVLDDTYNGACAEVMCMMFCENGYKKNKFGCDTCVCLTVPRTQCRIMKCTPCAFGMAYDEEGCRTCECLPDPCKSFSCNDDQVCQAPLLCMGETCRHLPRCIARTDVVGANIGITFVHEPTVPDVDNQEIYLTLMETLPELLKSTGTQIDDFQITRPSMAQVRINFHVQAGTEKDLVTGIENLRQALETHAAGTAITLNGVSYIPQHDTLAIAFHGESDDPFVVAESKGGDGVNTRIAMFVVAGVASVVFLLAVLIIISVRTYKDTSRRRTNIIYKRASMENDYSRPLTTA